MVSGADCGCRQVMSAYPAANGADYQLQMRFQLSDSGLTGIPFSKTPCLYCIGFGANYKEAETCAIAYSCVARALVTRSNLARLAAVRASFRSFSHTEDSDQPR